MSQRDQITDDDMVSSNYLKKSRKFEGQLSRELQSKLQYTLGHSYNTKTPAVFKRQFENKSASVIMSPKLSMTA